MVKNKVYEWWLQIPSRHFTSAQY